MQGRQLAGDVVLSPDAGNALVVTDNGLCIAEAADVFDSVTLTGSDQSFIATPTPAVNTVPYAWASASAATGRSMWSTDDPTRIVIPETGLYSITTTIHLVSASISSTATYASMTLTMGAYQLAGASTEDGMGEAGNLQGGRVQAVHGSMYTWQGPVMLDASNAVIVSLHGIYMDGVSGGTTITALGANSSITVARLA